MSYFDILRGQPKMEVGQAPGRLFGSILNV